MMPYFFHTLLANDALVTASTGKARRCNAMPHTNNSRTTSLLSMVGLFPVFEYLLLVICISLRPESCWLGL